MILTSILIKPFKHLINNYNNLTIRKFRLVQLRNLITYLSFHEKKKMINLKFKVKDFNSMWIIGFTTSAKLET